jgi:hypothetical protein
MACSRGILWDELSGSYLTCALARSHKVSNILSRDSSGDAALRWTRGVTVLLTALQHSDNRKRRLG